MAEGAIIGQSTQIRGNVRGDGPIEILGFVEGDVTTSAEVVVADTGRVKGQISGSVIQVAGAVVGNLRGTEAVNLEGGAKVVGDLSAPRIGVADGALVRGKVSTGEGTPAQASARQLRRTAPEPATRTPSRAKPEEQPPAAPAPSQARPATRTAPAVPVRQQPTRPIPRRPAGGRGVYGETRVAVAGDSRVAETSRGGEGRAEPVRSGEASRIGDPGRVGEGRGAESSSRKGPPPPIVPVLVKGARARKKKARHR